MARVRQLHPEFWTDPKVSALPDGARLAFLWSLNEADDEGRLRVDAATLGASVFRYQGHASRALQEWIDVLVDTGRWLPYEHRGERFMFVPHFHKWQFIQKPTPSRLPPPPQAALGAYEVEFGPPVLNPCDSEAVIGGPEPTPTLKGSKRVAARRPAQDETTKAEWEVFAFWKEAVCSVRVRDGLDARHVVRLFTERRRQKVRQRLAEGWTSDDLRTAVTGCLVSPWNRGMNPGGERWDDLELVCRDAEHVERFIEAARRHRDGGDGAMDAAEVDDALRVVRTRRAGVTEIEEAILQQKLAAGEALTEAEMEPLCRACPKCRWPGLVCAAHHRLRQPREQQRRSDGRA